MAYWHQRDKLVMVEGIFITASSCLSNWIDYEFARLPDNEVSCRYVIDPLRYHIRAATAVVRFPRSRDLFVLVP